MKPQSQQTVLQATAAMFVAKYVETAIRGNKIWLLLFRHLLTDCRGKCFMEEVWSREGIVERRPRPWRASQHEIKMPSKREMLCAHGKEDLVGLLDCVARRIQAGCLHLLRFLTKEFFFGVEGVCQNATHRVAYDAPANLVCELEFEVRQNCNRLDTVLVSKSESLDVLPAFEVFRVPGFPSGCALLLNADRVGIASLQPTLLGFESDYDINEFWDKAIVDFFGRHFFGGPECAAFFYPRGRDPFAARLGIENPKF